MASHAWEAMPDIGNSTDAYGGQFMVKMEMNRWIRILSLFAILACGPCVQTVGRASSYWIFCMIVQRI